MNAKCHGFCAAECINGYCPDIPTAFDDAEYSNGVKCSECIYNSGECSDCIFEGSPECVKEEVPDG